MLVISLAIFYFFKKGYIMFTVKHTAAATSADKTDFALVLLPYKIKLNTFELVDSILCQPLQGDKKAALLDGKHFATYAEKQDAKTFVHIAETFGKQGGKTLIKPFKVYNIPAEDNGAVVAQLHTPKEVIIKELSSIEKQMTRLLCRREHLESLLSRLT